MNKIKVYLVDDHPIVREGLRTVLEEDDSIEIVGEAGTGEEAIERIPASGADVVFMDIKLPGIDGVEAVKELLKIKPNIAFIILTSFGGDHLIRAVEAGAKGYLLKGTSGAELRKAIHEAYVGKSPIDPVITGQLVMEFLRQRKGKQSSDGSPLTPRETQILEYVARGNPNKQIAERLNISEQTIKNSFSTILKKLGAHDRTHAVVIGLRNNWIFMSNLSD